eukprot:gnl/TRDRNA2_/TRDRNA2_194874_c0_seq1.p1 gnl/TRDRNA2_/TRDRNA2_194874_c0~~gnl/TRDRNA2_/TRDRNA2_194874_c0_seq1.p1  ORF type:complete len:331 (-),score=38.13 gnl/TRDRNA2_/TRDRNA2_194874_c0_seq1:4-996(-)
MSVMQMSLLVAALGCIDGLRVAINPVETNRTAVGVPFIETRHWILQTPKFWKHITKYENQHKSSSSMHINETTAAQHAQVVKDINLRFAHGKPSNDIQAAGVVLHGLNTKGGCLDALKASNRSAEDNLITSSFIINSGMPHAFLLSSVGFVITSRAAAASLSCSYPTDGMSCLVGNAQYDAGPNTSESVAGCLGRVENAMPQATQKTRKMRWCSKKVLWGCSWPPNALKGMMMLHRERTAKDKQDCGCKCGLYNELVMKTAKLVEHMPDAIEAIYFLSDDEFRARHETGKDSDESKATAVRDSFAEHFGRLLPLLRVTCFSQPAPFVLSN